MPQSDFTEFKSCFSNTDAHTVRALSLQAEQLRKEIAEVESETATESSEFDREYDERTRILDGLQAYNLDAREVLARMLVDLEQAQDTLSSNRYLEKRLKYGDPKLHARTYDEWNNGYKIIQLYEERGSLEQKIAQIKTQLKAQAGKRQLEEEDPDRRDTFRLSLKLLYKKLGKLNFKINKILGKKHEILTLEKKMKGKQAAVLYRPSDRMNEYAPGMVLNRRYQVLGFLGMGGFAEVYKAFDLDALQLVAIKLHLFSRKDKAEFENNNLRHLQRENEVIRQLDHPNIIKYLGEFRMGPMYCTVFEFCEGEDLDYHLKRNGQVPEKTAQLIVRQLLAAVKYLNSRLQRIIHYDLKPHNVMLTEDNLIKILDFGLCKVMDSGMEDIELTSRGAGTYWYLPPECFDSNETVCVNSKVDVWSIGVIFFQMLYGQKPFGDNMTQERILKDRVILNVTKVEFPNKPQVTAEAKEFIALCLKPQQETRPDIFEACVEFQKRMGHVPR
jgi:tousled-like kinase